MPRHPGEPSPAALPSKCRGAGTSDAVPRSQQSAQCFELEALPQHPELGARVVSVSTVLRAVVELHPIRANEECAWPGWYEHFADQQCEDRTTWEWTQINMPDRHMMWWEAGYREWIGEDDDMQTETTGLGIHKAICALKLAIAGGGGIQKGRQAPMGYKFRGIEDFDNILCGLTAEHGIDMYPRILSKELRDGTTEKGKYQSHAILEIEWTLVCAVDGSKQVTSTMGEAMDTQDKAFNKAMQASRKYAILMVLMIPTAGDDTEIYVPEPGAVATHTQAQQNPAPQQTVTTPETPPEQAKRTRGPNKPKDPGAPLPAGNLMPAQHTQAEPTPTGYPVTSARTVDVPAEVTNPSAVLGEMPFPNGNGVAPPPAQQNGTSHAAAVVPRINTTNTFAILYAFAQDADKHFPTDHPDRNFVFGAIKARAIGLFQAAPDMKGVQEGFELVTALGQPDDLKAAANAAYGKFRK